jgi:hypothetical protein
MHRQFVVAIETEIGDRQWTRRRPSRRDGEPDEVVTVWAKTGAILRHGKITLAGHFCIHNEDESQANNPAIAWRGARLKDQRAIVPRHASTGFLKWPNLAADTAWE